MITIEQIKNVLLENVTDINIEAIPENGRLRDYGIDSLDYYNIIIELQTLGGIEVPDADIDRLNTINEIYKYFQERTN